MKPSMMAAPKENGTLILRYLKGSKKMMGVALWDVLSPVKGYNKDIGYPTFSLDGLKERGLIQ